jgi:hypothetical protein
MSTSQSADVVLYAEYWVSKSLETMTSTSTGTSSAVVTVNDTANEFDIDESLTILGGDIGSRDDWILVKLWRKGTDGSDTHNGYFNMFDIKVV